MEQLKKINPNQKDKKLFDDLAKINSTIDAVSNIADQVVVQQRELESYRKMMTIIWDNANALGWFKDKEGRYIFASPLHCRRFFRLDPACRADIVGRTDKDLLDEFRKPGLRHDFGECCVSTDEIVLKKKKHCRFIEYGYIYDPKTGQDEMFVLDVLKSPCYNDAGEIIGTVGIAWDMSNQCNDAIGFGEALEAAGEAVKIDKRSWEIKRADQVCHYKEFENANN